MALWRISRCTNRQTGRNDGWWCKGLAVQWAGPLVYGEQSSGEEKSFSVAPWRHGAERAERQAQWKCPPGLNRVLNNAAESVKRHEKGLAALWEWLCTCV
ncbi:hypothetical protein JR316_0007611 [Psilocybe cubensis]|uniref:Uncharacterized protein n=1 Tax=Psilocybe cubensis TaxID=181762 RepID=A0ACB8GUY0_PSICU|nr:hypothetical protein JR316_0007611 [Psilocybe cubensis]KAH9479036.1 hypothetical protein JR316_0007611 [Psilocybe cubensis]